MENLNRGVNSFQNVFQVKVLLRISPSFPGETSSFLKVDQKKKQVTLYDPTAISHVSQKYRRMGVAAPKMFAFDSIFEPDSCQVRKQHLRCWSEMFRAAANSSFLFLG
jgi:hypothetical protein